jgi:hypothetical protein
MVLWAYRTTTKKLHRYTPFQLVYGKEAVVPTEFITPSLYIAQATCMTDEESVAQRLAELQELEETKFLEDFHQSVEKVRQKDWHDHHIKTKVFAQGDKVLLYEHSIPDAPWQDVHALVGTLHSCGDPTIRSSHNWMVCYELGWVNDAHLKPYLS